LLGDPDTIAQQVRQTVTQGKKPVVVVDLPYTSRAKKVLELAMTEARDLSHSYVGTEHLLMGVLREERGIAGQVLLHAGLTAQAARAEILRLIGRPGSTGQLAPEGGVTGITVEIRFDDGHVAAENFSNVTDAIRFLNRQ
jgi:ATP-dependent Clp protease ATP-binding subunit ClpC